MAITFVNNLGLSEMGTGDNSGTWGNVTNVNLELIGQALGHGTRVIADESTDIITMSEGTLDDDRALYLKLTGGGQACTVTLRPATMSKVWIMENGTAAALTFTQGSGANVVIPAGDTKVIACTGGSGTAQIVYDVFASLSVVDLKVQDDLTVTDDVAIGGILGVTGVLTTTAATVSNGGGQFNGTVTVGVDDTGYDVKFFGDTASAFMLWDASADDLILGGAAGLSVNGTALVTGVLTTTASAVFNGGFTSNGDTVTFASANNADPLLILKNTTNDASGSRIQFIKDKGAAGADGDDISNLEFIADNDAQQLTTFAQIKTEISDASDGAEGGKLSLRIATHDGELQTGLLLVDGNAEDEIDVTIGSGNASVTTIAGNTTITSDLSVTGVTLVRNGTVSAPAIGNTGDSNTGMFFPLDNTIAFTEGGVERVRIDANGKVGFGTDDPTSFNSAASQFVISAGGDTGLTIDATSSTSSSIHFADGASGTESYRGYFSYNHAQDRMNMGAGAADVLRLLIGGNVDLVNGNLVVAQGHGIDFSAQTPASGTGITVVSELLDHYEEGTCTLEITADGGTDFTTATNNRTETSFYTRVGNMVTVLGSCVGGGAMSGGNGNVLITGLPFTSADTAVKGVGVGAVQFGRFGGVGGADVTSKTIQNATTFKFATNNNDATATTIAASDLNGNSSPFFSLTLTYFVA